jgi:hypothetical protein
MSTDTTEAEVPAPERVNGDQAVKPDAPYGYRDDGQPRIKLGRPKGTRTTKKAAVPPKKTSARPRMSPAKPKGPDYASAVAGVLQLVAAPLAMASPLDALTVAEMTPEIAQVLNQTAKERPEVAAVLEKVLTVGPYGALLAVAMKLGCQIAANHDAIPEPLAKGLGCRTRAESLALLDQMAHRQAA